MNVPMYYESLAQEMQALQGRVRNFLSTDTHWLTDGEWKESVLRSMLRRQLPKDLEIGRGAIISEKRHSNQVDLLIYSTQVPTLFRDGDLVFVTPNAVRGIIEVKSSVDATRLQKCLLKLADDMEIANERGGSDTRFCGVFAYDTDVSGKVAMERVREICGSNSRRKVDLLCLGRSSFIEWHEYDPAALPARREYKRWHAYDLKDKAPGYFLNSVVRMTSPGSVAEYEGLWFPWGGKEEHRVAVAGRVGEKSQVGNEECRMGEKASWWENGRRIGAGGGTRTHTTF